jgi:chemotaxis protein methyltransferase CheR
MVKPSAPSLGMAGDPGYGALKARIIAATGLVYYAGKDDEFARVLERRLAAVGVPDCGAYLALLDGGSDGRQEFDELVAELTIGETYFFRHAEVFAALGETVLPDLIERNRESRRLRIWSAGCANGAEPYSLAILLRRDFATRLDGWSVRIIGTDINKRFLAQAEEGVYQDWSLRATSATDRDRFFTRTTRGWHIDPRLRAVVSFQCHNLVEDTFPSLANGLAAFDLILCRNVVIYFDRPRVVDLVNRFRRTLVDGGWLVPGHAEADVDLFRAFETVNSRGAVLYRKGNSAIPLPPPWPLAAIAVPPSPPLPVVEESLPPLPRLLERHPPSPPPIPSIHAAPVHAVPVADLDAVRRLADAGQWRHALAIARQLVAEQPTLAPGHFYLALVLDELDELAGAEKALKQAIYLDRGFAVAHYHLGLLLRRRGDAAGSLRAFRNAVDLGRRLPAEAVLPCGDGITAGQLCGLATLYLDLVNA